MPLTTEDIITETLHNEGWPKYTDRPSDRGGPTKGGITLQTLKDWRGRPVIARDVEALDEAEVRAIYRRRFIEDPGYAGIRDDALRALVVECGVMYGAAGDDASFWLQQAANQFGAGLKVDGDCGAKTIAAVNALDPLKLRLLIIGLRLRKQGKVITDDAKSRKRLEDQSLNAAGWSNRLAARIETMALES